MYVIAYPKYYLINPYQVQLHRLLIKCNEIKELIVVR